jgi:ABC-type polysaccharide/polyol phosphate transport system ATPase subunit
LTLQGYGGDGGARRAIEVRDLAKSFSIPHDRQTTLKERALRPGAWLRGEATRLDALRGISFDVERGEFFGVVGRNGSGKTTLLKLLASIYAADGGSIRIAGRLAPFIELGVGFNPELNARDNVVLNGVMMGLTRAEASSRFERVIDYAELWDYTELKLKNYSFGMQVRLGFSMMLQVEADVLLVDEVLAVGDLAFQEKCIASLRAIKAGGTTVVLVTHDVDAVKSHCDRALLIEDGRVDIAGEPEAVVERLIEVILPTQHAPLSGGGPAAVSAARLTDATGHTVQSVPAGDAFGFRAEIEAREAVSGVRLTVELLSHPESARIASFRIGDDGEIPELGEGERLTVKLEVEGGSLQPGEYRLAYELGEPAAAERVLDRSPEPLRLRITGEDRGVGLITLAHRVEVDRSVAGSPR